MQNVIDLINLRREHIKRLATQNGAAGESAMLTAHGHYVPRPKGIGLRNLITALQDAGIVIRKSSFDAIALPASCEVDFRDIDSIKKSLSEMTFIEIKTSNQIRVRSNFEGFFFAFTEGEILASEALGHRHQVLLHNAISNERLWTTVPELIARARSTNWQVSIQL